MFAAPARRLLFLPFALSLALAAPAAAQAPAAAPPPPPPGWTGSIGGGLAITTDNSDWATNCPEYKVTAVQVMPVMQPSVWQQEYSRFNRLQHELLDARIDAVAATPTR